MEPLYIIILALVVIILFVASYELKNKKLKKECHTKESENATLKEELWAAKSEVATAQSEVKMLQIRAEEEQERFAKELTDERERSAKLITKSDERLKAQFQNLANEILHEKSQLFKQTNREEITTLLAPFKSKIEEFHKRVEDIHSTQNTQRGELKAELKSLMELNHRITTETTNLTNALKANSKVQGDWGEVLLETILDSSSLLKGVHYHTQHNIKGDDGQNLRPDVVLNLPENKSIVIDSKVSLSAYIDYTAADTAEAQAEALARHIRSVREHLKELSRKEYQRHLNSPDFVIMFIPTEPAFLTALQNDTAIWSDAYDKKVIISSPTNLFALLKIVADLWRYNDQDKNTKLIATFGLKLYEQLVAFTSSLEGVGTALSKAQASYDDAHKRLLSGNDNIIRVGERLRKTAGLNTKREHSKSIIEAAGEDEI